MLDMKTITFDKRTHSLLDLSLIKLTLAMPIKFQVIHLKVVIHIRLFIKMSSLII